MLSSGGGTDGDAAGGWRASPQTFRETGCASLGGLAIARKGGGEAAAQLETMHSLAP